MGTEDWARTAVAILAASGYSTVIQVMPTRSGFAWAMAATICSTDNAASLPSSRVMAWPRARSDEATYASPRIGYSAQCFSSSPRGGGFTSAIRMIGSSCGEHRGWPSRGGLAGKSGGYDETRTLIIVNQDLSAAPA